MNIPSSDGRLGDITGCEETGALPFDEDGDDRLELVIWLEYELEVEEL